MIADFFKKHANAVLVFILLASCIFYESSAYLPTHISYITGKDINIPATGSYAPNSYDIARQTTAYKNLTLEINFRLNEYGGHQGLFQTADYNTGVRFEVGPNGGAGLMIGREDGVFSGFEIPKIELNKDYHLLLKITPNNVTLSLNNVHVVDSAISTDVTNNMKGKITNFEVTDVKIGAGFDDARIFKGSIRDFSLWYTATKQFPIMHHMVAGIIILCLMLLLLRLVKSAPASNKQTAPFKDVTALSPLLLAAYPVLFHYAHNIKQTSIAVTLSDIWVPLGMALACALVLLAIFFAYTRDKNKAVILASISVFGFAIAGHIYEAMGSHIPEPLFLSALLILFMVAATLAQRDAGRAAKINSFVLVITSVLSLTVLMDLGSTSLQMKQEEGTATTQAFPEANTQPAVTANQTRPDIYIILADGYAHNDTLRQEYGFDNTAFLNTLKDKGFLVPRHYHSNYNETHISVPSFLNMEYHPFNKINDNFYLANLYQNAAGITFLKKLGYKFFYINPSAAISKTHQLADVQNPCSPTVTDFFSTLLDTTALFAFKSGKSDEGLRALTMCGINSFIDSVKNPSAPKLVFYHFFKPHYPYIFNADGGKVDPDMQFDQKSYVGQLKFTSKTLLKLVDTIKATSTTEPVIILLSDHGGLISGKNVEHYFSSPSGAQDPDEHGQFNSPKAFGAFYLPNKDGKEFGEDMSGVNILRLIFNAYFGTSYKRLEDKSIILTYIKGHEVDDVTDILKKSWLDTAPP